MTCIAGVIENDVIYMGGDSAGVSGQNVTVRTDPKVFPKGDMLIGFTTSFRMGQLIQYSFTPPSRAEESTEAYLTGPWVNALRKCLKDGGFARENQGEETGGQFLLGYEKRLFTVWSDYQVAESADPFESVGSGSSTARGSLYSTAGDPHERVLTALSAAARYTTGVCAPFNVEILKL